MAKDSNSGLIITKEENSMLIRKNAELFAMPNIDLNDPEQVKQRIGEYFEIHARYGLKPTVAGLGLALNGYSRQTLWAIANDKPLGGYGVKSKLATLSADYIKKTYKYLETLHEDYMTNGKINPVMGIFLSKNLYGYQDKVEIEASSRQEISTGDYGSVADRYKQLPEE